MSNKETDQFKPVPWPLILLNQLRDFLLKSKMVSNNHSSAQTPPCMFTIHYYWISNTCKSIFFSAYNSIEWNSKKFEVDYWAWTKTLTT